MSAQQTSPISPEKKQRLLTLFEQLIPLVDGVSKKLRFVLILGTLMVIWIGIWLLVIKHYSLIITLLAIGISLLPLLILLRFWWAFEELKELPAIAGQMMGDAKDEIRESVQDIRAGNVSKLSFLNATKGLWSVGAMLREGKDLIGSYISMTTLVNPFMLVLGVVSLGFLVVLILVSIMLVFLAV